jgi:hypothetical protein
MPEVPPGRPGCRKTHGKGRPLPDPAGIRLFLVPDPAPPYDADPFCGDPGVRRLPAPVARGGAAWPGEPAYEGEPGRGEPAHGEPAHGEPGVRRLPAAVPGAPPGWQSRFAQALAETLAGARPPRQMVPWATEEALDRIRRLGPQLASAQRPRVRRVLTSVPAADVMELAVVVGFGPRVKAMAVRLERSWARPARPGERAAGRWVCTALEVA